MVNRKSVLAAAAAVVLGVVAVATTEAFVSSRENILTFSGRVALPGVELPAGTYRFEVVEPGVGTDTVRVWTGDKRRVLYTGLTLATQRPHGMPRSQTIVLGESPRGQAPPIRAWYPLNESTGHQFIFNR